MKSRGVFEIFLNHNTLQLKGMYIYSKTLDEYIASHQGSSSIH